MEATWSVAQGVGVGDRFLLLELHARYAATIDEGDARGWAACFMADGVLRTSRPLVVCGHEALEAFAAEWHAGGPGQPRHMTWQHRFAAAPAGGGEVTGTCYAALLRTVAARVDIAFTAVYHDRFVPAADGWRIRERVVALDGARADVSD